jgi:hypothetical protein
MMFRPRQLSAMAAAVMLSACCSTRPQGGSHEPAASLRLLTFARDEADVKAWVSAMGPEALNQLRMKKHELRRSRSLDRRRSRIWGYVEDALIFRRIKEAGNRRLLAGSSTPLTIEDDRGLGAVAGASRCFASKDSL